SVNGHDELAILGFQIYSGINVFSRFILWGYVGISNHTSVSVNKQFLYANCQYGFV
ncbi:hypothetical protein DFH27DRAFT_488298, partial [Peziza echinospora]